MQSSPKRPPRAAGTGLVSPHRIKADTVAVDVDVDRRRRSHLASTREARPFTARNARTAAVGQSSDRSIWIVDGSLCGGRKTVAQKTDNAQHDDRRGANGL